MSKLFRKRIVFPIIGAMALVFSLDGHKDICTFRIHSISKAEYDYLWAAAALVNTYEAGVLLSNPPIVPSNVAGGTGIFGVSSEAVLRHEDVEKILRTDIIQIWPRE